MVVVVVVVVVVSATSAQDVGCAHAAMALTPAVHVLIVARERITEYLCEEGAAESARLYADSLAQTYWRGQTLDVILADLLEVLPADLYDGILGFTKLQYPLAFSMLPRELRTIQSAIFSRSEHNPHEKLC